ncbi:MAG: hypothetical protein N4A72_04700 [Bacteroidales bacterium]|nr:hypothetical protein [Bacteroidales bacterium]
MKKRLIVTCIITLLVVTAVCCFSFKEFSTTVYRHLISELHSSILSEVITVNPFKYYF